MKILSIQFKNINNLKGEHQAIRFDEEPLSSAGIFAITGPTGSGKSTLLDVITLSLFNKIPRYKKAISKKEIDDLGSVVTHHTNDAYAKVEYEIKNNRFTSEWKVCKNRNGKFKDYEMYLYDATGQPLDLKKSEVPAKNEELIGLQYDQFVKSIILSQGEFSRFLQAEQNERGQLLENITGTSIYRKIGRRVFEKQKEVKSQLETKKEIVQNFQTLNEDEIKEITTELKEITVKKKLHDTALKLLAENVQIKKDLSHSKAKIENLLLVASKLNSKKEAFKSSLTKLQIHNKLAPVKGDIALYKDTENNRVKTKENLSGYKAQIVQAKKDFELSISQMASLTKKEVTKENFMTVMKGFENEILALDKDIENSISKGKEIREVLNKKQTDFSHDLDKSPDLALSFLEQRIKKLNSALVKSNFTLETSTTENKKKLKQKKEYYNDLLLVKHDLDHLKEAQITLGKAEVKLKEKEKELIDKTPLKEKSEKLLTSYQDQIITLRKRKDDALKIASLEGHRSALNKGEPCPLCGSTEHPYSLHKPDSPFSEIEKQIEKVNKAVEAQRNELEILNKFLTECNTNIKVISEEIKLNTQKLKDSEKSLEEKKEKITKHTSFDIEKIEQIVTTLNTDIETLEESLDALEELKLANELKISFTKLKEEIKKHGQLKKERTSKFDGKKITDVTDQIQNAFQEHKTSITRLTEAIEKETKDLDRAHASLEKHKSKLNVKLEVLGFESIEEMSQNLLEETEALHIVEKENELKKLFTENKTQLNSLKENIAKLTSTDKTPDKSYEELDIELSKQETIKEETNILIGEKTNQLKTDEENRKRQKEHISEIENLKKDFEKWSLLSQMIGDSNGNKFANFSQGLTLQNLLVYANHRLKNLSDRYLLDKPKDGGPLRVVDQFQGNTHRAVSTLSGGESFLISLALALSLSDMASRNVSLESLFIDEGFGTLDQETLDVAMNTLEKLQSESQKMVGVISHVEALKERITVQIKLEKNGQGFSNISVVQN